MSDIVIKLIIILIYALFLYIVAFTSHFNDDGCYLDGGYDLTEIAAWQPLPKPYKGE